MHPYLKASLELELAVQRGTNFNTALAAIGRAYMFTQGERELIAQYYTERQTKGKRIRPVEHHAPGNRRKDVR